MVLGAVLYAYVLTFETPSFFILQHFLNRKTIHLHFFRYMSRPVMSGPGLYDPTTIMNADILAYCQKEGWCKLAFYLLSFFYYLYG